MKLEELKAMSTKELTALYNKYAEKRVKRMESRAKLEERTIQKLREAGELEEESTTTNSEDATMSKTATTTKKSKSTKTTAEAPAKKTSSSGKRGAPVKNPTYVAIAQGSRGYNPKMLRINPNSSRARVLEYIAKAPAGRTKKQCEEKFADMPEVNVPSALYFLVRHGFASVKDEG